MTTPTTVQVRLQIRADTAANWTSFSPVLLANELGLETDTKKFKIGDGNTSWQSLAYFPSIVSGGTVLGNLEIGTTGTLTFEGSTANGFETTLGVVDPTADRTILLPNQSGTVVVGGNASIVDADIAANAEIAVSKLADGAARQLLQTDAAGTGVEWASNIDIPGTLDVTGAATFDGAVTVAGDLTVNGTTTTISTQNLLVEDKNIILGDVATPTDVTADGGGITLKGATDKTINWIDSTDAWTSSERFSVPLGSAAAPSLTFTGDPNTGIYSPGADQVAISTGGSGRLFVDASGLVGIGTATPETWLHVGNAVNNVFFDRNESVVGGPNAVFRKSRGIPASRTIVNAGDFLGALQFTGFDGSVYQQSAIVRGEADGAPSLGSVPGRLIFLTQSGGVTSERLRITSAGLVGVGTSSPDNLLSVRSTAEVINYTAADFRSNAAGTGLSNTYIKLEKGSGYGGAIGGFIEQGVGSGLKLSTLNSGTISDVVVIRDTGRVGIGTTSPVYPLSVQGPGATPGRVYLGNSLEGLASGANNGGAIYFGIDPTSATATTAAIESSWGGSTNPQIHMGVTRDGNKTRFSAFSDFTARIYTGSNERVRIDSNGQFNLSSNTSTAPFVVNVGGSEVSRIDGSGRLLVGTSSALEVISGFNATTQQNIGTDPLALFRYSGNFGGPVQWFCKSRGANTGNHTVVQNNDILGQLTFTGSDGTNFVRAAGIVAEVDGTPGTNDMPGRLVFSTTTDGASSPTRRVTITSGQAVIFGDSSDTSPASSNLANVAAITSGRGRFSVDGGEVLDVNRRASDGDLVWFRQDGAVEGTISVSGTTVSYNGAHLSRWSQLLGGVERIGILRGTVLSNIDEMCEWGEEDNEQLNRMKVSDVEGDKNVAGVFQAWDDDDDTYTNDFYCAMTGDFIIRIGAGVTVERGDLLMSAGDGTAKPQDDDIIRSKTIAKVTSTNVSCTYDDGSYCVPCVLMAC